MSILTNPFVMSLFTSVKSQSVSHARNFVDRYLAADDYTAGSFRFGIIHLEEGEKLTGDYLQLIGLVTMLRGVSGSNPEIEKVCSALIIRGMQRHTGDARTILGYTVNLVTLDAESLERLNAIE